MHISARRLLCLTTLLSSLALPAVAAEEVSAEAVGGADLTIYNGDLALVRERRNFRLPSAEARVAFPNVSAQMRPETALVQVMEGGAISILEQTFDFNTVSPERLLESAVGDEVTVISTNPATGRDTAERARVIAVQNGLVLEIGGRIHTTPPGRVVFDRLPPSLRTTPTLLLDVGGTANRESDVELSYLTGGISWHADYVAQYDADAGHLELTGWATVTNTSGIDFNDARLRLVAGDVNITRPELKQDYMAMNQARAAAAPMADGVTQESFVAFHIYSIARPTSLGVNQSKQMTLLGASNIPVTREYISRGQPYFYMSQMPGPQPPRNADTEIVFMNDASANLSVPLPAGVVRVYGQDSQGAPRFMGEDRINHTPDGGEVRVKLGSDFDLPVTREQTNYVRASDTITLTVWKITVKNAKDVPVKVKLREPIQGQWEISRESHPHEKVDAATAEWTLDVPSKGETVLEYTVRTQF